MGPKISIITVSYNAEKSIENTIKSVLSQTYGNIEYIIVDGNSNDTTLSIIKRYENRISKWISESDKGLYDALNKGIRMATGDWIGILNCGDVFCSGETIKQIFCQAIEPHIGVVYGNCNEFDGPNKYYKKAGHLNLQMPPEYRHGASFVRRNIHEKFLFATDETDRYKYSLDYHQIFRMYKAGISFSYVDVSVIDYEKEGISNNPWQNKYLRSLIISGGKKNIKFYMVFVAFIIQAIKNKIKKNGH